MTEARVPRWLKIAWTLWTAVWATCYWRWNGPQDLLWFCPLANFGILVGLWAESSLVLSWQACSVLMVDALWILDVGSRLLTGEHWIGGTTYMFDPERPVGIRILSLYHVLQPGVLLWGIRRLGYHRRGWLWQCAAAWIVLPISQLFDPSLDINWSWGPFDTPQSLVHPKIYLVAAMIGFPLLLYLPTHVILSIAFARREPHAMARPGAAG